LNFPKLGMHRYW